MLLQRSIPALPQVQRSILTLHQVQRSILTLHQFKKQGLIQRHIPVFLLLLAPYWKLLHIKLKQV